MTKVTVYVHCTLPYTLHIVHCTITITHYNTKNDIVTADDIIRASYIIRPDYIL